MAGTRCFRDYLYCTRCVEFRAVSLHQLLASGFPGRPVDSVPGVGKAIVLQNGEGSSFRDKCLGARYRPEASGREPVDSCWTRSRSKLGEFSLVSNCH